ncbi:MAG TPA: hypothetical protein VNN08_08735 [Thermoanaerobaculia bacterium]|nr:hypothetical protein [Thermoanaerobaculia bacterium]
MPRQAVIAALITVALYGTFAAVVLRRNAFDASRIIVAGDEFTDPADAPKGLSVAARAPGYDAQFYYRLTLAPLSAATRVAGIRFDYPVYRAQRIGYPLLVRLLSGANPQAIPWVMLLLNIAAGGVIAATAATIVTRWWTALAVALFPGFLLTISRDLVELIEIAFLLLALRFLLSRRIAVSVLFLTLAVLTKETAILFALAAGAATLVQQRAIVRASAFAIPVAAYIGWKLWLFRLWNLPPNLGASDHFALPFAGVAAAMQGANRLLVIEAVIIALFTIVVAMAFRSSRAAAPVKLAWVAYAALIFTLGVEFWREDWSFLRAASDYAVFGTLIAVESEALRVPVALLVVASWLALAGHIIVLR